MRRGRGRGRGAGRRGKPRGFGFAAVAFHPFFPPCPLGVRVCFWGFLFLSFLCENVDDAGYFVRKPRIDGVKKTDILTK